MLIKMSTINDFAYARYSQCALSKFISYTGYKLLPAQYKRSRI